MFLDEPEDRVQRAAYLVGKRRLQRLDLEEDVGVRRRREPFRSPQRRPQNEAVDAASRCRDVGEGYQDRAPVSRIPAS